MDPIPTSIQLASTHWTGLIRFKPLRDAGLTKHMITRQFGRVLHCLHADRTRRVSLLHGLLHRDSLAIHLPIKTRSNSHQIRSKQRNDHFEEFYSMAEQNLGLVITPSLFPFSTFKMPYASVTVSATQLCPLLCTLTTRDAPTRKYPVQTNELKK